MKYIAHRGNTVGPSLAYENSPELIYVALSMGFDAEIDVWYIDNQWYLGHNIPQYKIEALMLRDNRLWCHAKNLGALSEMKRLNIPNFFWHETDKFTLTSSGYIWTYPGGPLTSNSIAVIQDNSTDINMSIYGVCSDYVNNFRS